jgi:hypothetical protein
MAKASSDRNTIDLFGRSPGRPRSKTLSRKDQLKFNKRQQREKEKTLGLKRLELVIDQETINKLDQLCEAQDIKRSEWITLAINNNLETSKTIKSKK